MKITNRFNGNVIKEIETLVWANLREEAELY